MLDYFKKAFHGFFQRVNFADLQADAYNDVTCENISDYITNQIIK